MPVSDADRPRMSPAVVVMTITLLLSIQPISTDLYLPTLPTLQRDLGASIGATQMTLSALIICFGFGQLLCGPLSDRFGRRPILLIGMALYTVASVLGAVAQSIDALIVWRALQGLTMAAAVTCGRSIVRDLFQPHEGARVMSRSLGGLGLIAMAAPMLGGLLVQTFNWHAALLVTGLYGAAAFAFLALKFDETLLLRNPHALRPSRLLRNWVDVLANPTFRAWTALLCCTWGGLFFLLAGSSFVFINVLGTSRFEYGVILATSSVAYIVGTFFCRRLLLRHGLRGAVRRGALFSVVGGAGMAALSLGGVQAVWAIVLPQLLFAFGHGIHQPCGQAGVVGPFPEKAGTAASVSGFAMMLTAFLIGLWLGRTPTSSVFPVTLGVGASSVMLAVVALTLVQRHGDPHTARSAAQAATV